LTPKTFHLWEFLVPIWEEKFKCAQTKPDFLAESFLIADGLALPGIIFRIFVNQISIV